MTKALNMVLNDYCIQRVKIGGLFRCLFHLIWCQIEKIQAGVTNLPRHPNKNHVVKNWSAGFR